MQKKQEKNNDLIIGISEGNNVVLTQDALELNTAIIGLKGSRKSSYILPTLCRQLIYMGEDIGSTYITTGVNDGDLLFAMAKRSRKKNPVIYLKPSRDLVVYNEIINDQKYDYKRFNEFFNFANMIRKKAIVIIDAEEYKYHELAKKFIEKIIYHIYLSMQDVKETLNYKHVLCLDTADSYLNALSPILRYSNNFKLSSILFLESRSYLSFEDQKTLDLYVRNKIILSNITKEDKDFYVLQNEVLGDPDKLMYSIMNNNRMINGIANLASDITENEFESLLGAAKKARKDEKVSDNGIYITIIENRLNGAKNTLKQDVLNMDEEVDNKMIDTMPVKDLKEVIVSNMLEAKEPYNGDKYTFKPTKEQLDYFARNLKTKQQQLEKEAKEASILKELNAENKNASEEDSNIAELEREIKDNNLHKEIIDELNEPIEEKENTLTEELDEFPEISLNEDIIISLEPEIKDVPTTLESELAESLELMADKEFNYEYEEDNLRFIDEEEVMAEEIDEEPTTEEVVMPSDFVLSKGNSISLDTDDKKKKSNEDEKVFLDVEAMLEDEDE